MVKGYNFLNTNLCFSISARFLHRVTAYNLILTPLFHSHYRPHKIFDVYVLFAGILLQCVFQFVVAFPFLSKIHIPDQKERLSFIRMCVGAKIVYFRQKNSHKFLIHTLL